MRGSMTTSFLTSWINWSNSPSGFSIVTGYRLLYWEIMLGHSIACEFPCFQSPGWPRPATEPTGEECYEEHFVLLRFNSENLTNSQVSLCCCLRFTVSAIHYFLSLLIQNLPARVPFTAGSTNSSLLDAFIFKQVGKTNGKATALFQS